MLKILKEWKMNAKEDGMENEMFRKFGFQPTMVCSENG